MSNQPTVSDIFRRALEIRQGNANISYKDIKERLVSEFNGKPFPNPSKLTIPEYDNIAPEEDWTEIAHGIIISLEQVENYPKESGREDAPEKNWRDRNKGIAEAEAKNLSKWMPEELMAMAQNATKKN